MRKGIFRIIIGVFLILLQTISVIGNASAGVGIQISFSSVAVLVYDIIGLVSYFFVGIVGCLLLFSGIIAFVKSGKIIQDHTVDNNYTVSTISSENSMKHTGKLNQASSEVLSPAKQEKSKIRFCKLCGSLIDPDTKNCTGCGKQYFRFVIKPYAIILSAICLVFLVTTTIYYVRSEHYKHKIEKLNESISEIENTITRKDSTIANLKAENAMYLTQIEKLKTKNEDLSGKLSFYDSHVVFIPNNNSDLYHKYDCFLFALVKETTPFWAFNTEQAKSKGYSPCLMCCQ